MFGNHFMVFTWFLQAYYLVWRLCIICQSAAQDHRNHTFEKLSVAYGRHKKKIRMEAAGLRRRRKVHHCCVGNCIIYQEMVTVYGGERSILSGSFVFIFIDTSLDLFIKEESPLWSAWEPDDLKFLFDWQELSALVTSVDKNIEVVLKVCKFSTFLDVFQCNGFSFGFRNLRIKSKTEA